MNIDFACKQVDLRDIVMCSFNLSKTDYKILTELLAVNRHSSIAELSKRTGLERSTIQKAVKNLLSRELVTRGQVNKSSGGYVFTYKSKDKGFVREKIMSAVNSWSSRVEKEVTDW